MMIWIHGLVGLYLVSIALMIDVPNMQSAIVFKLIPFIGGSLMVLDVAMRSGIM